MEIVKARCYNEAVGWSIFIRDFKQKNFSKLEILLKNLD